MCLLGQFATLAIDGWSNLTNDPVVGISLTTKGKTCLIDAVDTTGQMHTTEYMTELTSNAITKAEELYDVNIGHVVTDGASNMKGMRNKIKETLDRDIITYHCQPHLLNLLAKDVKDEQTVTVKRVTAVLKFFRNKHSAKAKLKELNVNTPPLPAETRWNTLRDSLAYYCENWATLVQIIADLQGTNGTERKFLENVQIRSSARDLLAIFDAITAAINRLQSDTATIAEAVESWLELIESIGNMDNPTVSNLVKIRSEEMLVDPAFLAANLLDHRYLGKRLTSQQMTEATKYITDKDPEAAEPLTLLLAGVAPYDSRALSVKVDPQIWWVAGKRLGYHGSLCKVALHLTSAVANSAGLERQFSTLKFTYGSLRTNLGVEKAGKLAFCYRSLNQ